MKMNNSKNLSKDGTVLNLINKKYRYCCHRICRNFQISYFLDSSNKIEKKDLEMV